MSTTIKILLVFGVLVLFGLSISAFSLALTAYNEANGASDNLKNTPKAPGPAGPKGDSVRGQVGPPGPAGGLYYHSGWITSRTGNYILNRTGGVGEASVAYLDKPDYVTNQYWLWGSDNTIKNKYGPGNQCLSGNDKGQVYIDNCSKGQNLNQRWLWTNRGQINWQANKGKCLTVVPVQQLPGYPALNPSKADRPYQIALGNCEGTPGTNQQWFLGH